MKQQVLQVYEDDNVLVEFSILFEGDTKKFRINPVLPLNKWGRYPGLLY